MGEEAAPEEVFGAGDVEDTEKLDVTVDKGSEITVDEVAGEVIDVVDRLAIIVCKD